jgi:hypothetical protein
VGSLKTAANVGFARGDGGGRTETVGSPEGISNIAEDVETAEATEIV